MGRFNKEKSRPGGKMCVGGGPGGFSCRNTQYTNVSLHLFPSKIKEPSRYRKWVQFLRRHRHQWKPSQSSRLCSEHFEVSCFDKNPEIARSLGMLARLKNDAVPTIDAVPEPEEVAAPTYTERGKRQVPVLYIKYICINYNPYYI